MGACARALRVVGGARQRRPGRRRAPPEHSLVAGAVVPPATGCYDRRKAVRRREATTDDHQGEALPRAEGQVGSGHPHRGPDGTEYRERVKAPVSSMSAAKRWAEAREREAWSKGPPPPPS